MEYRIILARRLTFFLARRLIVKRKRKMRFLFTGALHLIDESPIVFSARKAYFRVGAGSPCADRFHVRSLRRIRLLIRKSDELSAKLLNVTFL